MKIEYLPAAEGRPPRFYFRPETSKEQRTLTIFRDMMYGTNNILRCLGAEHSEKKIRGMPPKPVINLGLSLETKDGKVPPQIDVGKRDPLDPNVPTPTEVTDGESPVSKYLVAGGTHQRVQVVEQKHGSGGGPSTVIQES